MGLTRSSSGLLVFDGFGTDTTASYTVKGTNVSYAVSTGTLERNGSGALHGQAVRASDTGVLCITGRAQLDSLTGDNSPGIMLSDGTSDTYYAGYVAWLHESEQKLYFFRVNTDWAFTSLGSTAFTIDATTYYPFRVYSSGTTKVARAGATLATVISVTDETYSPSVGGISDFSYETRYDWLDLRTAHTITCTGMTEGHYLRVSDGTTAAEAAADGAGLATVDAGAVLFPLATVSIYTEAAGGGSLIAELDTEDYADMGGGDVFTYSSLVTYTKEINADGIIFETYPTIETSNLMMQFVG